MFPVGGPNPTPQDMNYTVVINSAVWGGALLYYFIDARKWYGVQKPKLSTTNEPKQKTDIYRFTGPKMTLDLDELTETQETAIREEGLEIAGLDPARKTQDKNIVGTDIRVERSSEEVHGV